MKRKSLEQQVREAWNKGKDYDTKVLLDELLPMPLRVEWVAAYMSVTRKKWRGIDLKYARRYDRAQKEKNR